MKTQNKILICLAIVALCVAASLPTKKISEYPTTTTNDVTDLILLARTNDVGVATNYNEKVSNFKKFVTNETAVYSQLVESTNRNYTNFTAALLAATNNVTTNITAAVTEQTNKVTTNITAAVTAQTNTVTTNIIAAITEQTNRVTTNLTAAIASYVLTATNDVTTNLLAKTVLWTPQTNAIMNTRAGQVVYDNTANHGGFWVTNNLVATNSVIVATIATLESTSFHVVAVPGAGVFLLQLDSNPDNATMISFLVVP
jgi:uncharacterized membrane protein YfhO